VGGQEQEITDESQGDSRETQAEIERMLGMSHDMFKHIVALNTYTEPFLALKSNDQRTIIEQLLGITMLSDKADTLKEQLKATRDTITAEEYRIKAVTDANARIQEQIEATRRRQTLWNTKRLNEIDELKKALTAIGDLDIEQELLNHDTLQAQNELAKAAAEVNKWKIACEQEQVKLIKTQDKLKTEIEKLEKHECYACGQAIHDNKHEQVLNEKRAAVQETSLQYLANDTQLAEHISTLAELGGSGPMPTVFYDTKEDAINHKNTLANLRQQLAAKETEVDPYAEQIQEMVDVLSNKKKIM
jgi:DNA repair exonuclease SbcCD ATPase subunit